MTCIVGLVEEGTVYMGGDSLAVSGGWLIREMAEGKVFRKGEFLFGVSGMARYIQVLKYRFVPPPQRGDDVQTYMQVRFVDGLRQCLRESTNLVTNNGLEELEESTNLMVGYRGSLYRVDASFGLSECGGAFLTLGSGDEVASGAMAALEGTEPEQRVLRALEIAGQFNMGVRPPYYVEVLKPAEQNGRYDPKEPLGINSEEFMRGVKGVALHER